MNTGTDPRPSEAVFATPDILRDAFEKRLTELLELDQLGVFILVLANAGFERQTFDRLQRPLAVAFERWRRRLHDQDPFVTDAPPVTSGYCGACARWGSNTSARPAGAPAPFRIVDPSAPVMSARNWLNVPPGVSSRF